MVVSAIPIGFSGMRVATARLDAAASNIANIDTAGAIPGTYGAWFNPVYQPVQAVASEVTMGGQSVGADVRIKNSPDAYFAAYAPTSPYADAQGMMAMPSIDLAAELVETSQALQQFKASALAVRAMRNAEKSALDMLA